MDNLQDNTSPTLQVIGDGDEGILAEAQRNADLVATWVKELALALKREESFRKVGREVVELYESEREDKYQFNILFSNTETLAPALYNSTPRPVVDRRFKDDDPLGKKASLAVQRVLEYLIDSGEGVSTAFDQLMSSAVLEALLPGRGVTWFKYEPTWSEDGQNVESETVCGEEVPWDRFRHGYAKKWSQVPWAAREHLMTKEEASEAFGDEIADELSYEEAVETSDEGRAGFGKGDESTKGAKLAQVFEVWDKATKGVLFIAPSYPKAPVKQLDDPLKLANFLPCPQPLQFVAKVSSLTPVALYKTYREQAKELNTITTRINKLVAACKVRGIYDSTMSMLESALQADDNVLKPVDNIAALVANGMTLEKSVWLVPIEKIVSVLQQLYLARDQVKSTIYEITGIADIMRGASQASETLGAQQIKNQWGTLRLKRSQKRVANYVRESLRIMAEIAIEHFSPETLSKMTGLPWPTPMQKQQMQMQLAGFQQQGLPPPPELLQAAQQDDWGQILDLLKNDLSRSYRIDIETNSTVDAEATEDKQNITDLVNAMAQFMNGVAPLVESGSMPFDVAKTILLTIVRRFRFGPDLEDALKGMQAPQPKPDPKAQALQAKAQADAQNQQAQMKMAQDNHAMDMQAKQLDFSMKQKEATAKAALAQQELQIKQEELQMKREELRIRREDMLLKAQLAMEADHRKAELGKASHAQAMQATKQPKRS